jgi:ubiquinone/menaquinone biosynthesis C-methylase UbiE
MNARKATGERMETFVFNEISIEHLHRYAIADKFIEDKNVLDIACGDGYGSYLMSSKAKFVTGVDIDADVIKDASQKYIAHNLSFQQGSSSNFPVENDSIDIVVSFETIEHHDEHAKMFDEIKRVLKKDGILIMSSPDKKYYSDNRNYKNPFHVKELYFQEFKKLVASFFKNHKYYFQNTVYGSLLIAEEQEQAQNFNFFTGDYTKISKDNFQKMYNICVASDSDFQPLGVSFFENKLVMEIQKQQTENFYNTKIKEVHKLYQHSKSFIIGRIITLPFRILKKNKSINSIL